MDPKHAMPTIRRQLSLFVTGPQRARLDSLRAELDPVQARLIPAHVTLARDDEVESAAVQDWRTRCADAPALWLHFGAAVDFDRHGVKLPCIAGEPGYRALREHVLGRSDLRAAEPHLTLAHPRNARAPGNRGAAAVPLAAGMALRFAAVHWIEQRDHGPWQVLDEFPLQAAPAAATVVDLQIRRDDLEGAEIRALLSEHLRNMHQLSPPESVHALDLSGLKRPEISFWCAWSGAELLGCGALKELDAGHGEIKSMRTPERRRRGGVARALLEHIVAEARRRGYRRLSLETGAQAAFAPARQLYASAGFEPCAPFGDYREDPHSVFMTLTLADAP